MIQNKSVRSNANTLFTHPLTEDQKRQIEAHTDEKITKVWQISVRFENEKSYESQLGGVIEQCAFTPEEWQTLPILIVPPSFNFIDVSLHADPHGIMGYFSPVVRPKPVPNSIPPRFEVAKNFEFTENPEEVQHNLLYKTLRDKWSGICISYAKKIKSSNCNFRNSGETCSLKNAIKRKKIKIKSFNFQPL